MNKKERIGQLRDRVSLQSVSETQSASGYPTESWSTVATRWAEATFRDVHSGEEEASGQKTAITAANFRLRYDESINQKNRLVYNEQVYDIQIITISQDRSYMTLFCKLREDFTVPTTLKIAQAVLYAVGSFNPNAQVAHFLTAQLFASGTLVAEASGGTVVILAEADIMATATVQATLKIAKQLTAELNAYASTGLAIQKAIHTTADLQAAATLAGNGKIAKVAAMMANATATLEALAVSETQGVAYATALLSAQGNVIASIQLVKQLQAELNASGNLIASAVVGRIIAAALMADASIVATAQAVKVATSTMDAMAETTLNAVISRSVTATLEAFATTDLQAIISKAVQATVNATANTSVIAVLANQCVALLSAAGTLSATAKKAVYRSASLSAAGTLSATGTVISGAVTDPYFANVSLLLHMDGANNGTSFLDNSINNKSITRYGAPVTSTTQVKFGTASGYFNGSSLVYALDDALFNLGTSDFTWEFWAYFSNVNGSKLLISRQDNGTLSNNLMVLRIQLNANKLAYLLRDKVNTTVYSISGNTSLSANVWYHIALTRASGVFRLYLNGVLEATNTPAELTLDATNTKLVTGGLLIGTNSTPDNVYMNGYIDDVRLTKNVARYTANFTPPTKAFPNS